VCIQILPYLEKVESLFLIDPQLKTDEKDDNSNKQEQQQESTIIDVKESIETNRNLRLRK